MAIRKTYARRLPPKANGGMPHLTPKTPGTGYMMVHDVKRPRFVDTFTDGVTKKLGTLVPLPYEGV